MIRIFLLVLMLLSGVAHATTPQILVMGDSLSAAYGIEQTQGWVALLQTRLRQDGFPHEVINASVSGETTAGGLRRLPGLLEKNEPVWVLIELGANDGLRAQSLDEMESNLRRMVALSQQAGARVLLFEMRIPSNYGPRYTASFRQRFHQLAETSEAQLLPFFLQAIATDPALFQDDGIHPTAAAQPMLLEAVWSELKPQLKKRVSTD